MKRSISAAQTRAAVLAVADWIRDESAPMPPRAAIAKAVRLTARTLEAAAPGQSVEVRIPPFVGIQCIAGPRHTRGTPPNVVEADARTWLRLATGLVVLDDAVTVDVSGTRAAEIAHWLPLVPLEKPSL